MLAVDTNIVVRLLAGDDAAQSKRAKVLFAHESVYLSKTVVLETEWVLRRAYGFDTKSIFHALRGLISLPNVVCECFDDVNDAIGWMSEGLDLADALHLSVAKMVGRFATFDRKFQKRAVRITSIETIIV